MKTFNNLFEKTISLENLFSSWNEFKKEKQTRPDVMKFEFNLEQNIFQLHNELKNKTYKHDFYILFTINDPKPRNIHKASIKDRIVHHAVFKTLNIIFDPTFIYNSYSCRINKGTHRGINNLEKIARKVSKNNKIPCFVLKCDIKKFFASIDQKILLLIIRGKIKDNNMFFLTKEIIASFPVGLPLGNVTSQLFANIYLNKLDQFIKQKLKIPFYIRYTDDFVIISENKEKLLYWLSQIKQFLSNELLLELHPNKVFIRKYQQGIDFLGYIQFPHHRTLRKGTKKRIINKIRHGISEQSLQSYLGVLSHANEYNYGEKIKNLFWLNQK